MATHDWPETKISLDAHSPFPLPFTFLSFFFVHLAEMQAGCWTTKEEYTAAPMSTKETNGLHLVTTHSLKFLNTLSMVAYFKKKIGIPIRDFYFLSYPLLAVCTSRIYFSGGDRWAREGVRIPIWRWIIGSVQLDRTFLEVASGQSGVHGYSVKTEYRKSEREWSQVFASEETDERAMVSLHFDCNMQEELTISYHRSSKSGEWILDCRCGCALCKSIEQLVWRDGSSI